MPKIYCAGPLFNDKEKEEMQDIADCLETQGYNVFLPHRDGFEFFDLFPAFANLGVPEDTARYMLNKAIFTLDVFQVLNCDGLVLNINGRVPDEGALVEAGIAWSAGKIIVIYKNDARTLLNGNDNPLLLGLAEFEVVNNIRNLAHAFNKQKTQSTTNNSAVDTTLMKNLYNKGEQIACLANKGLDHTSVCRKLMEVLNDDNGL